LVALSGHRLIEKLVLPDPTLCLIIFHLPTTLSISGDACVSSLATLRAAMLQAKATRSAIPWTLFAGGVAAAAAWITVQRQITAERRRRIEAARAYLFRLDAYASWAIAELFGNLSSFSLQHEYDDYDIGDDDFRQTKSFIQALRVDDADHQEIFGFYSGRFQDIAADFEFLYIAIPSFLRQHCKRPHDAGESRSAYLEMRINDFNKIIQDLRTRTENEIASLELTLPRPDPLPHQIWTWIKARLTRKRGDNRRTQDGSNKP
jgi:hypothetical protein